MEDMVMNSFWKDKRVFVTGATGLLGSWLVTELADLNADVVILVRDWVPKSKLLSSELPSSVTVVRGDITDRILMERIINEYEIEIVIHLAAQAIVPIANRNPVPTFESNIRGTWNLLEACRLSSTVRSIVVASSDKAYGDTDKVPYTETLPLGAVYPYDVSKACTDMICVSYAKTFDVPVSITRCGNFFGGGDLNWNRIVPGTIRSIYRGKSPVIRSDGSLVRDYIYVEDATSAYLTLAESLFKNPKLAGEAFNFSNESQMTVFELVNYILEKSGSVLKPDILGQNHGEIEKQYLDSSKANTILHWNPKFGLENGLAKTLIWYREFFEREAM